MTEPREARGSPAATPRERRGMSADKRGDAAEARGRFAAAAREAAVDARNECILRLKSNFSEFSFRLKRLLTRLKHRVEVVIPLDASTRGQTR